jgi:hypothetical protein
VSATPATEDQVQELLLECGFRGAPRGRAPAACRWSVVGDVVGAAQLRVDCMTGARGGFVLLVASDSERQILAEMLAQNGVRGVDVRAERMERGSPWLALGFGSVGFSGAR